MQIEVPALPADDLQRKGQGEPSDTVRARVEHARGRMLARQGKANGLLESAELEAHCRTDDAGVRLLQRAMSRFGLSARSYHRTLKVARSIADLAAADAIGAAHVGEALGYRRRLG